MNTVNFISKYRKSFVAISLVSFISTIPLTAAAIAFGTPDNQMHKNMGSVRFVKNNNDAFLSCTGSLLYKDNQKYVILTAGHCAEAELGGWNSEPAGSGSVGISFDEINLPTDADPSDGGADGLVHVTGGVALVHPLYRFPGEAGWNDSFDIALVVFPINAVNSYNETIAQRWGDLQPVNIASINMVNQIVNSVKDPKTLTFTAVGFGTASTKSPQGAGVGNKEKIDENSSFPNRNVALVSYKNLNGEMINVQTNMADGTNTGYLCGGDSGGPIIYKNNFGVEIVLGVLTQGNCRSSGGYSRIDLKVAKDFVDCAFVTGGVNAVTACVNQKFSQ